MNNIIGIQYSIKSFQSKNCNSPPSTVAEAISEVGYPRRRYVAQNFNCSDFAYGLRNCNYSSSVDPECSVGPHVAGVRCRESMSYSEL